MKRADSSSSSDGEYGNQKVNSNSRSALNSLFASDSMHAKHGVTSLRYEDVSKRDVETVSAAAAVGLGSMAPPPPKQQSAGTANSAAQGPVSGNSSYLTAAQAVVAAYRGGDHLGTCVAVLCAPNVNAAAATTPFIALVDRERRPLCRVLVTVSMQLIQNAQEKQYATLYDANIGGHWTLLFKSSRDCTQFVVAALSLLHFVTMEEGPTSPVVDLVEGAATKHSRAVQFGDTVSVSLVMWLVTRVSGSRCFTIGKTVEEIPAEAPRSIEVGSGEVMVGVDETLVGLRKGSSRLVFVGPKKTKVQRGLGNPEIGAGDTAVVLLECHGIAAGKGAGSASTLRGLGSVSRSDSPSGSSDAELWKDTATSSNKKARTSRSRRETSKRQPPRLRSTSPAARAGTLAKLPAETAVPVASASADPNSVLQAFLLHTLQQQQQANGGGRTDLVERMMDRLLQQVTSLSDKVDRLAIEEKIASNNAVIDRMVKKAVGKLPINDVDLDDMEKDRGELLATVEQWKQRAEEATANYHRALEAMGRHKDEVRGLENDLAIQRETLAQQLKQLGEHRRLQAVEMEVKHRQELDRVSGSRFEEGRQAGYAEGLKVGRMEALESVGSSSFDEMKQVIFHKEQRIVQLETEYQQLEGKRIEEKRGFLEQIQSLNDLIKRYESRQMEVVDANADTTSQQCKILRRAMNSTYSSIEAQLYAFNTDSVLVEDALRIALVAIKSETRTYTEVIRQEAVLRTEQQRQHAAEALREQQSLLVGSDAAELAGNTRSTAGIREYLEGRQRVHAADAHAKVLAAQESARPDNESHLQRGDAVGRMAAAASATISEPPAVFVGAAEDLKDGALGPSPNDHDPSDWVGVANLPPPPPATLSTFAGREYPPPPGLTEEEAAPLYPEVTETGASGQVSSTSPPAEETLVRLPEQSATGESGDGESASSPAPPLTRPAKATPRPRREASDDDDDEW